MLSARVAGIRSLEVGMKGQRHVVGSSGVRVLPSWQDNERRRAIVDFVQSVSTPGHPDFVVQAERIAVFDHDGTLWCEQPVQVQLYFALDRMRELAEAQPELRELQPYRAFLERDVKTIATFGKREALEFAARTHAGITIEEFAERVRSWLAAARHPALGRLFTACVYQPQLELLEFLRANKFRVFIVSGGGVEFIRCLAGPLYGIPPEHVMGSSNRTRVKIHDGHLALHKMPELRSFNDREEKVVNVELHIGRRPILAFGNSDGDLRLMQYVGNGARRSLVLLLHHDDAEREFAYDREFRLSPLDEALQEARELGWCVVSMKHDWRTVFPATQSAPAHELADAVAS
jgi:phosphoserine phosphatase